MGSVNLDNTGSGNAITLSSDGTSLLLNGTAIGGGGGGGGASALTIDIKTANYTVVSGDLGKIIKYAGAGADRTVSLTAGASLGDGFYVTIQNANSGTDERVIIDPNGTEKFGWSNGPSTITLKRGELVKIIWDNTSGRWIIGEGGFNLGIRIDNSPSASVQVDQWSGNGFAAGYSAFAGGTNSVALGTGYSSGSNAAALGASRATGSDSFAAAIGNNGSSYGSTGTNSVAIGKSAKAQGTESTALGPTTQAQNSYSVAIGHQANSSNDYGVAIGRQAAASGATSTVLGGYACTASGSYSTSVGGRSNVADGYGSRTGGYGASAGGIRGKDAFASQRFSTSGDAQTATIVLKSDTTNATAEALTTNNSTASTDNQVVLPNNSAYAFHGTIVARQQAADGTACAAWKVEGLIRREGSAGTTVLVNSATTVLDNTPNWGMALSADTTNGCLKVQVTGAASTDIRWVATIHTSEVTYA